MFAFYNAQIHKIRGETHLALMNFSWAMDLDPKGASNQIKELIDRHYGNDDEIMIHSNNNSVNGNSSSIQDTSAVADSLIISQNTTPFQQRSVHAPSGSSGVPPINAAIGSSASHLV